MAKTITLDADKVKKLADKIAETKEQKPFEIISANIKDLLCNYGYEQKTGVTAGDVVPTRKGAHFIHDDLKEAFEEMAVFLAHIDGAFNSWTNNQTHLQELEAHEDLSNYYITAFKIQGVEENRSVVLSGSKSTPHGDISFSTPKIKLDGTYLYLEELELRLQKLIEEVELYMGGKQAPQYEQSKMDFDSFEQEDDAFEKAKVQ